MKQYSIKQVEALCDVDHQTVLRWINLGYLKAHKENDNYRAPFIIEANDLDAFISSDKYKGYPKDIASSRPFNRTPILENCYPVNLAYIIITYEDEKSPNHLNVDIWDVNFRKLKELISNLPERSQRVIVMRYQFGMTLDEVGAAIGLTRERIRQIQIAAIRTLKRRMRSTECFVVPQELYSDLKKKYESLDAQMNTIMEDLQVKKFIEECKEKDPVRFYTMKIEELNMSVRSYNCLKRANINTVGDIIGFDKYQAESHVPKRYRYENWEEIRNLGRRSLQEIAEKVYEFCGYRIRYYDSENKYYTDYIPLSYTTLTPNVQELKL